MNQIPLLHILVYTILFAACAPSKTYVPDFPKVETSYHQTNATEPGPVIIESDLAISEIGK